MPLDNNFIAKIVDKRFIVKADSCGMSEFPTYHPDLRLPVSVNSNRFVLLGFF